jgi:hypothetical protein
MPCQDEEKKRGKLWRHVFNVPEVRSSKTGQIPKEGNNGTQLDDSHYPQP